jgi:hypothetical protein
MIFTKIAIALVLVAPALAGQFPEVDGVVGGVPSNVQHPALAKAFTAAKTTGRTNATVGTLRYKENSGFCGEYDSGAVSETELKVNHRDDQRRISSLRLWRHRVQQERLVGTFLLLYCQICSHRYLGSGSSKLATIRPWRLWLSG